MNNFNLYFHDLKSNFNSYFKGAMLLLLLSLVMVLVLYPIISFIVFLSSVIESFGLFLFLLLIFIPIIIYFMAVFSHYITFNTVVKRDDINLPLSKFFLPTLIAVLIAIVLSVILIYPLYLILSYTLGLLGLIPVIGGFFRILNANVLSGFILLFITLPMYTYIFNHVLNIDRDVFKVINKTYLKTISKLFLPLIAYLLLNIVCSIIFLILVILFFLIIAYTYNTLLIFIFTILFIIIAFIYGVVRSIFMFPMISILFEQVVKSEENVQKKDFENTTLETTTEQNNEIFIPLDEIKKKPEEPENTMKKESATQEFKTEVVEPVQTNIPTTNINETINDNVSEYNLDEEQNEVQSHSEIENVFESDKKEKKDEKNLFDLF